MKKKYEKADREFQRAVIERDGCCQVCGMVTETLVAHHIVTRRRIDTRHDLSNGITLCYTHHRWAHDRPAAFRTMLATWHIKKRLIK